MPSGTPIARHCIVVLHDGRTVIDWGHRYQDILTGDFAVLPEVEISHKASNDELEALVRDGIILDYDEFHAYLGGIPERFSPPLD
ncbi:MAG: hypothetical protein M1281_17240 [Chloroflexi bacterium]|nr:hypothetical protein [Chloroflexota bacterium]